jgi:hypothetical protein
MNAAAAATASQKEYDGSDEAGGHGVRERPPGSAQILKNWPIGNWSSLS